MLKIRTGAASLINTLKLMFICTTASINGIKAVLVGELKMRVKKAIMDPQEICNILNSHFVNNEPILANTLPKTYRINLSIDG